MQVYNYVIYMCVCLVPFPNYLVNLSFRYIYFFVFFPIPSSSTYNWICYEMSHFQHNVYHEWFFLGSKNGISRKISYLFENCLMVRCSLRSLIHSSNMFLITCAYFWINEQTKLIFSSTPFFFFFWKLNVINS